MGPIGVTAMSEGGFGSEALERMQGLMEDLSAHLRDRRLAMAEDDLRVMEEAIHQLRRRLQILGSTAAEPRRPAGLGGRRTRSPLSSR